jgi:Protein of unknown function (DUF3592)
MDDGSGTLLLVGAIFLVIGVVLFAIGGFLWMRTRRFLETAVDTTGVIVDLLESSGSDGGTVYQAVVEFQTREGQTVRWTESMASSPAAGDVGDQLPMKYNPDDPNEARIARAFRMWFVTMLLSGMGLMFGATGLVLVILGVL